MSSKLVSLVRRGIKESLGHIRRMELAAARRHVADWRHHDDVWADFRKPIAVGDRYGDLTVEAILGRKPGSRSTCVYVLCRCRCRGSWSPGWRIVRADNLRAGATTSCGCFKSHKQGDLGWPGPGTAHRGRYRTYIVKEGDVLTGQAALAELLWPALERGPGAEGRAARTGSGPPKPSRARDSGRRKRTGRC
jgi:hypothetical protein